MAAEQVIINATDLVTTGRVIEDTIAVTRADGLVTIAVDFVVQGDTVEAMQELYQDTIAAFTLENASITITFDSDAASDGEFFENITPNTARYGESVVTVTPREASWQGSGYAMPMRLIYVVRDYGQGATISGANGGTEVTGLAQTPKISVEYQSGRIQSRTFLATFVPEDGNTGQENYEAARDDILTNVLGTGADGVRDETTGLALSAETIERDGTDGAATVVLRCEYIPYAFTNARRASIGISAGLAPRMAVVGGALPLIITVSGALSYDSETVTDLATAWATSRDEIEAYVAQVTGESGFVWTADLTPQYLPGESRIQFNGQAQARNTSTIRLSGTTRVQVSPQYVITRDSDGADVVQTVKGPPQARAVVTFQRVGLRPVDLRSLVRKPPAIGGGRWLEVDSDQATEEPEQTPAGTLYTQSLSVAYRLVNFRGGQTIDIADPRLR